MACRSEGIPVRSWDDAVAFAQDELARSGDLEERLEGYAQTASRLSAQIAQIERVRPALEAVQRLRDLRVPLIGNGWQILLTLVGLVTVDGAKLLAHLEETLRICDALKQNLDNLQGLSDTAHALRAFRATPTPRNLEAVARASALAVPSMTALHADLGRVLPPLDEMADGLGNLVKGLRAAAAVGIPGVSDAAGTAAERIGQIEPSLVQVRDGLRRMRTEMGADLDTLKRIQRAVQLAREQGGSK